MVSGIDASRLAWFFAIGLSLITVLFLLSFTEAQPPFCQQKNTGKILFDAYKSTTKDISLQEFVVKNECYKNGGKDSVSLIPDIGDGVYTRETEQENLYGTHNFKLKPLSNLLLKRGAEEKPCSGEILKEEAAEMQNVMRGDELIAGRGTASSTVSDSESVVEMYKRTTASYFQGI